MTKIFKNLILITLMVVANGSFAQERKAHSGDKISHKENTSIADFVSQINGESECQLTVTRAEMLKALHYAQKQTYENLGREYQVGYLAYALEHLERRNFSGTIMNGYKDLATGKIEWIEEKVSDIPMYGYELKSGGKKYFILVDKENCYNPVIGYALLEDEQEEIPVEEKSVVVERQPASSQSVGNITQNVTVLPDTSGNTYITNNYYSEPQQQQLPAQQYIQSPMYGYGDNCLSAGIGIGASASFGVCGASMWANNLGGYYGPCGGGGSVSCGGGVVNNNYSYTYVDNSYNDNSWSFVDNSIHIHDSFNQDPHVVHPPTTGGPSDPPSGDPPIYVGFPSDPESRKKNVMLNNLVKNQSVRNASLQAQKSSRTEQVSSSVRSETAPRSEVQSSSSVRTVTPGKVETTRNVVAPPKRTTENPGYVSSTPRSESAQQVNQSPRNTSNTPSRNQEALNASVRNPRSMPANVSRDNVARNNTRTSSPTQSRTASEQRTESKPRVFASRTANERTVTGSQGRSGNSQQRYNQQQRAGNQNNYQQRSPRQVSAPRQNSQPRQMMSQSRPAGGGSRPMGNMNRGSSNTRPVPGFARH